jgi:hypothetical protein
MVVNLSDAPLRTALAATIDGLWEITTAVVDTDPNKDTNVSHLRWMLETLEENINDYPTDKISRWIGYVQGVMAMKGLISVKAERDRTRPLFHDAYSAMGQSIPPTLSNKTEDHER